MLPVQKTKLSQLATLGQSVWLDYINRAMLEKGELKKWIEEGLRGMTSNPTIFNQAISSSNDYDEKIVQLKESGKTSFEIYDELTCRDIKEAADFFKPVYEATNRLDGYVSLEINPKLANDTTASITEGRRLFKKVGRPNVMIKVPATNAGFPVIEALLGDGINVNVTLIFSLEQYVKTAQAYLKGMTGFSKRTTDLSGVRSVASVFVSRIDNTIDVLLDGQIKAANDKQKEKLQALKGKAAVANCRLIFEKFREMFVSDEFRALSRNKADVQRPLWASTSTKNPDYSDVKYVAELISRPTVNTMPEKTLKAFLDHGVVKESLGGDFKEAEDLFVALKQNGIDINQVCLKLLDEGVVAFEQSFESLLSTIETKANKLCAKS